MAAARLTDLMLTALRILHSAELSGRQKVPQPSVLPGVGGVARQGPIQALERRGLIVKRGYERGRTPGVKTSPLWSLTEEGRIALALEDSRRTSP